MHCSLGKNLMTTRSRCCGLLSHFCPKSIFWVVAEAVRFELTEELPPRQFSRVIFVILYNILRYTTTINSTPCRCKSFVRVRPMLPVFDSKCPTIVPYGTSRDSWFECQICGLSVGTARRASSVFDAGNTVEFQPCP